MAVVHGSMTTPVLTDMYSLHLLGTTLLSKEGRLETFDIRQAVRDFTVAGITYATSMATDLTNHKESRSSPRACGKSRIRAIKNS